MGIGVGPMSNIDLVSRRQLQTKILQVLLRVTEKEVVDLKLLNLLAIIMGKIFWEMSRWY